jgi:thioredoxin-related protein
MALYVRWLWWLFTTVAMMRLANGGYGNDLREFLARITVEVKEALQEGATETPPPAPNIRWGSNYAKAREEAKKKNLPLLLLFRSEKCLWCQKLDDELLEHPQLVELLNRHFVLLRLDTTKEAKLVEPLCIEVTPTIVVANCDGTIRTTFEGFKAAEEIQSRLQKVLAFEKIIKEKKRTSPQLFPLPPELGEKIFRNLWRQTVDQQASDGTVAATPNPVPLAVTEIRWRTDYGEARTEAKRIACESGNEKNMPLFMIFREPHSMWCKVFEDELLGHQDLVNLLNRRFIPCRFNSWTDWKVFEQFSVEVRPTLIVADRHGKILFTVEGFVPAEKVHTTLLRLLRRQHSLGP